MRVVLDTNILIGALITASTPPDRLRQVCLRGEIEPVTYTARIRELASVLARERLRKFLDADEAAAVGRNIGGAAVILDDPPACLSPDPMDNLILAAAIAEDVNPMVSGDEKHMLALEQAEGIPIVDARTALRMFRML